jgi:hypothetical protein
MRAPGRFALLLAVGLAPCGCTGPATIDAPVNPPPPRGGSTGVAPAPQWGQPTKSLSAPEVVGQPPGVRCIVETVDQGPFFVGTLLLANDQVMALRDATEVPAAPPLAAAERRIYPEMRFPLDQVKVVHLFEVNPQARWRPANGWKPAIPAVAGGQIFGAPEE